MFWSDPDPVSEMRLDSVFKMWWNQIFKIWSDPNPVWTSRLKIPLKLDFSCCIIDQSINTVLKYQLVWLLCRKKKKKVNFIGWKLRRIQTRFLSKVGSGSFLKSRIRVNPSGCSSVLITERQRDGQRDWQKERGRERDRETDSKTERYTERQIERDRERDIQRDRERLNVIFFFLKVHLGDSNRQPQSSRENLEWYP